jgi:hypothetical protein
MGNFVQIRRGIVEHAEKGSFTEREFGCHLMMILLADKKNGVWIGSAKALAAKFGTGDLGLKEAKKVLSSLEEKGYIHRLLKPQGTRGNFPIYIDRYLITVGGLKGRLVNAAESVDPNLPVVYEVTEETPDATPDKGTEAGTDRVPYSRAQNNKSMKPQEKTSLPSEPSAPADEPGTTSIQIPESYRQAAGRLAVRFADLARTEPSERDVDALAHTMFKAEYTEEELLSVMDHALTVDPWWSGKIQTFAFFTRNIHKLIAAQASAQRSAKAAQLKAQEISVKARSIQGVYKSDKPSIRF